MGKEFLHKALNASLTQKISSQPEIFNLSREKDNDRIEELFRLKKIVRVSDDFKEQYRELFAVQNPHKIFHPNFEMEFDKYFKKLLTKRSIYVSGRWVYFPWNGSLTHVLEERDFIRVRTARNKYLITNEEQEKFSNATIGIAGLSVGFSAVLMIVLSGGSKHIKLADFDTLALSNMNRVLSSVDNLGVSKIDIAARAVYEINPYAKIEFFRDGITEANIKKFFSGLDLVVEEIDSFPLKLRMREEAKKNETPLIMATDNEEQGMLDLENYRDDAKTQFFNGRLGVANRDMFANLNKMETGAMIARLVGPENTGQKMKHSLSEIGKTIVSWPQLAGTAFVNGGTVAHLARRILSGEKFKSGRIIFPIDTITDDLRMHENI